MPRNLRGAAKRVKPAVIIPADVGCELTPQQKRAKIEMLTDDFPGEVQRMKQALLDKIQEMTDKAELVFKMEIARIPKRVREMEVTEFLKAGVTVDAASIKSAEIQIAQESIGTSEVLSETANPTKTKGGQKKKKNLKKKEVASKPGTGKTRSRLAKLETPMVGDMACTGWDTPLITPKFDPRLPITPANLRVPKPGEILTSLAGSPVCNQVHTKATNKSKLLSITEYAGQHGSEAAIPATPDSKLAALEKTQLLSLQQKISSIIKMKSSE